MTENGSCLQSPYPDVLGYVCLTWPQVAEPALFHEATLVVVIGDPCGDAHVTGLGTWTPGRRVWDAVFLPHFHFTFIHCKAQERKELGKVQALCPRLRCFLLESSFVETFLLDSESSEVTDDRGLHRSCQLCIYRPGEGCLLGWGVGN